MPAGPGVPRRAPGTATFRTSRDAAGSTGRLGAPAEVPGHSRPPRPGSQGCTPPLRPGRGAWMLPSPPGAKRRPPRPLGLRRSPSRDEPRFLRRPGCSSSTHLAARQRSGSGSGFAGGGGGSSMAAAGVTAKAGGGTSSAAASLIRARSPAWPWRALSCSPARGAGVLKCGSDSAPPPPSARRRSRSRRGHLGNGDRPAPATAGGEGQASEGGGERAPRQMRGGGPRGAGRRERPGWPAAWATQTATREAPRGLADSPRGPGSRRRRRLVSPVGARAAGWSAMGVRAGPREGRRGLGEAATQDL